MIAEAQSTDLEVANLKDLVGRAKRLTEIVLASDPAASDEARDLLKRILAHEAIHDTETSSSRGRA